MIVVGSLRAVNNEWILDEFASEPFYIIVKKGNTQLLDQVNSALEQLEEDNPQYQMELRNTYYSSGEADAVFLTSDEKAFVEECVANNATFTAVINPDRVPASYVEDGSPTGYLYDILNEVLRRTGLSVEFLVPETRAEYWNIAHSGEADIVCDYWDDYSTAEEDGYLLTLPYYDSTFAVLTRDDVGTITSVALPSRSNIASIVRDCMGEDVTVVYYEDIDACVEVVRNGEVDALYTYTRNAQRYVASDEKNQLVTSTIPNASTQFCIGVRCDVDHRMASIINKSVSSMSDSKVASLVEPYMDLSKSNSTTLLGYVYDNPPATVLTIVMVCLLVFVVLWLTLLRRKNRQVAHANESLEKALARAEEAANAKSDFLSRIENGEFKLHRKWHNLNDMISSVISIVQPAMDDKHIDFQKPSREYLASLEGREFFLDEMRYEQVLINLLNNACKFTPEGGRITWSQERVKSDDKLVTDVVSIADTGCGVSKEFVARIGEPFMQEENPYSAAATGTGLGLYIVNRILSTANSRLNVESELGAGTIFSFRISYRYREVKPTDQSCLASSEDLPRVCLEKMLASKRVLLVEDNEINREISKRLLEKVGMRVSEAENGQAACDMFEASEVGYYDAILMNIRMPIMDGYAATSHIRALRREDAAEVPLIAMTANAFAEDVKMGMDVGMTAYLSEPVDPAELYHTLAFCIDERHQGQSDR